MSDVSLEMGFVNKLVAGFHGERHDLLKLLIMFIRSRAFLTRRPF